MIEQISPELVLVCPELRAAALASLTAPRALPPAAALPDEPAFSPSPPMVVQAVVYTVWQMLLSGLTALTAVTVVAVFVLAIGFVH